MTKLVMYTRVSSEEQAKVGYSIPFQLARCEEYAAKMNATVVERFTEAHSAKATGRPEFDKTVGSGHPLRIASDPLDTAVGGGQHGGSSGRQEGPGCERG